VRAFFAPGARALRRALLDGRSQKLLTPLLVGIEMGKHYEWTRAVEDQSAPIPKEITSKFGGSIHIVR